MKGDTHPTAMTGTPEIVQDDENLKIYKYQNGTVIYSEGEDVWYYAPDFNGLSQNLFQELSRATDIDGREATITRYRDLILKYKKLFSKELADQNNPILPYFFKSPEVRNI